MEPNDTRGALEGSSDDGNPCPVTVMTKPPSREERLTVVEDAIGLMSDRFRGLEKRMVYGSGETATSTDSTCARRMLSFRGAKPLAAAAFRNLDKQTAAAAIEAYIQASPRASWQALADWSGVSRALVPAPVPVCVRVRAWRAWHVGTGGTKPLGNGGSRQTV